MLWFEAGRILRRLLLPLIVGGVAVSRREGGFLAFIIVSGVISVLGFISRYLSFRYRLTADGIELREGIFTRRQRNIALARISHINTHQNALARFMGVVRLDIETEGGGAPEASFAALSLSAAEQIRQHIGQLGRTRESEQVIYEASLRDRVLAGATTFQLGGIFVGALLVWRYGRRLSRGEGAEVEGPPAFFTDVATLVNEFLGSISASPTLLVLTVTVALLAIWGLGIVVAVLRWRGFRITERGGELQLQSGILSRSHTVIARERTQAVEIRSNLARNALELAQIAIVVAGSARSRRARSRIFVPITSFDRASDYLSALWPAIPEDIEWQAVHPYYRRQQATRGALLLLVSIVVIVTLFSLSAMTVAGVTLMTLAGAWLIRRTSAMSFARTGFAMIDGFVHVRSGAVNPRRWIVAVPRIQAVSLRQSLFQRRRGVMDVLIDVNGLANRQRIAIPSLPWATAEKMQRELTPHGSAAAKAA
jgi:putative membrane protein